MTSTDALMIVSGTPYTVTGVGGRTPTGPGDFAGAVTVTVHGATGEHEVAGTGVEQPDGTVRLYQKDHHGTGKDVRVWTVTPDPSSGGFVAAG
ncbi:hypothetical protein [Cellulomonas endophytica]|uniref:hypothetical protein n=1 Tax=Cellulomonas endophytica TaxID=2494735 RepID=UPI00101206CC|nr:hypothetical protein [Cellulomonas endophytica]